MDKYLQNNRDLWNEITPIHARSKFYNVEGFKNGSSGMLYPAEIEEMGNISGKSLLHLQCHFGMDTLSWARRGAKVTGVDFSDKSIELARSLSSELDIKAEFICSDIYDLPAKLNGKFDIVYTGAGALCWLPDLKKWAEIIAHFLKRGGFFYIREFHPFKNVFDDSPGSTGLKVCNSYFHTSQPIEYQMDDYTGEAFKGTSYEWTHSLGDIINALIEAGLRIEYLHEYPACGYKALPCMKKQADGMWHIDGDKLPLVFSLKARRM